MKNNNELNYFNETRKQELDKMIADFSDEGCMLVEDMFTEFNACFRRGYDRSNGKLTVSFGDELGCQAQIVNKMFGMIVYTLRSENLP